MFNFWTKQCKTNMQCVVSNYIGYANSFGDTLDIVGIQINALGSKLMSQYV